MKFVSTMQNCGCKMYYIRRLEAPAFFPVVISDVVCQLGNLCVHADTGYAPEQTIKHRINTSGDISM